MKQIGLRAHDLGTFDSAEQLASAIAVYGPSIPIQLAIRKVLRDAPQPSAYTETFIRTLHDELAAKGTYVGVFGCYINPVHPDKAVRDEQLTSFEQHLRFANLLGCPLVGTETGSLNADCSFHPDTAEPKVLDVLYRSIDRLIEAAAKYDAIVGVEAVSKQHTISTIDRMAALAEKFDTPHLKIIYDPVNLIPWTGLTEKDGSSRGKPSLEAQRSFVNAALDAFGSRIAALHVKDFRLDANGYKIGDLPFGEGVFDWKDLFSELRKRSIEVPALLENANPATLADTLSILSTY